METYKLYAIGALAAQLKRGPRRLALRQLLGIEFPYPSSSATRRTRMTSFAMR